MDDVDAMQAQMARNMLTSGDWVTGHLDGVKYLEKAPLIYWAMAVSYKLFGAHDWAARLPVALSAIGLCLLTAAFGAWAFGRRAGLYGGIVMSTCVGLWLFTRIQIPDVMISFTIALAMWSFLRALDEDEPHPRLWAALLAASMGVGLLLKSLIGIVFPIGGALLYLLFTRQLFSWRTWKRLYPISGLAIILLIAAPWHVLATLRNPPYFVWTLQSRPGEYHGFLWFFFINEQLLRFLGTRYPHDYNTVPRWAFWLFHLVWLFPWSVYFPAAVKLSYKPVDRAGRTRLLALCWAGFLLIFFTFSTTQEYYSMPAYAAMALLLGSAMDSDGPWIRRGTRALTVIAVVCALAATAILVYVRHVPTPGDISSALTQHPEVYTLSLGHMEDLTLDSFAYLRLPLAVAAIAFVVGVIGTLRARGQRAFLAMALMMVLFFHAARLALVVFDPYMSSRPLANALLRAPEGKLIVHHHYYPFSSVFFYTNRTALLLDGKIDTMVYGSSAPDVPDVFIDYDRFRDLWMQPQRWYLVTEAENLPRFETLVGRDRLNIVKASGGKLLLSNQPVSAPAARLAAPLHAGS